MGRADKADPGNGGFDLGHGVLLSLVPNVNLLGAEMKIWGAHFVRAGGLAKPLKNISRQAAKTPRRCFSPSREDAKKVLLAKLQRREEGVSRQAAKKIFLAKPRRRKKGVFLAKAPRK
jgi:hypothetical protein